MVKETKITENEVAIKKQLAQLKAELEEQNKKETPKKSVKSKKIEKTKAKTTKKIEKTKAKTTKKIEKTKAKTTKKIELEEVEKTPEEELEEQFSDEQIRNFQIEKMDMDRITNKDCEIVAAYEDKGMLQSDLWKKLKLSNRDGSRLALRLERRGLISREKILQKDRWTYKLIIEQTPISLESLQNSPCLTCPVEQKCDVSNVFPEPSPLNCQLIEDWVIAEFSKKKK